MAAEPFIRWWVISFRLRDQAFCELPRVAFPTDDGPYDQLSSHSAPMSGVDQIDFETAFFQNVEQRDPIPPVDCRATVFTPQLCNQLATDQDRR